MWAEPPAILTTLTPLRILEGFSTFSLLPISLPLSCFLLSSGFPLSKFSSPGLIPMTPFVSWEKSCCWCCGKAKWRNWTTGRRHRTTYSERSPDVNLTVLGEGDRVTVTSNHLYDLSLYSLHFARNREVVLLLCDAPERGFVIASEGINLIYWN